MKITPPEGAHILLVFSNTGGGHRSTTEAIIEALIAGLPMVLFSRLLGQEEGNVSFVVDGGAGVWAPRLDQITSALCNWLTKPEERAKAADACLQLASPQAARQIARILV
jgi:1,2-diacylglycerol 3-beta-galactosyltransferase